MNAAPPGSSVARAETKVELKGTHLCCGMCVKAVGDILKGVDGATGKCDQKAGTVTITAKDDAAAQKTEAYKRARQGIELKELPDLAGEVARFAHETRPVQPTGPQFVRRQRQDRNDQAQRKGSAPHQALGDTVGPVAKALDHVFNALPRLTAGGPLVREDVRNRADRDVCRASHVANGDSTLTRLAV